MLAYFIAQPICTRNSHIPFLASLLLLIMMIAIKTSIAIVTAANKAINARIMFNLVRSFLASPYWAFSSSASAPTNQMRKDKKQLSNFPLLH